MDGVYKHNNNTCNAKGCFRSLALPSPNHLQDSNYAAGRNDGRQKYSRQSKFPRARRPRDACRGLGHFLSLSLSVGAMHPTGRDSRRVCRLPCLQQRADECSLLLPGPRPGLMSALETFRQQIDGRETAVSRGRRSYSRSSTTLGPWWGQFNEKNCLTPLLPSVRPTTVKAEPCARPGRIVKKKKKR